jgi:hypothetical protein
MGVDVGAGGELLDYGLSGARWQRSSCNIRADWRQQAAKEYGHVIEGAGQHN